MRASEYVAQIQEMINEHGDLELWCGKDEEGNGWIRPYAPSLAYVHKDLVDNYELDGGELTTHREDIKEHWAEDYSDEEPDDNAPSAEQLDAYIAENYVMVFAS